MANRTGHLLALTSLLVSTPLLAQAQTLPSGPVRPTPLPAPVQPPQTLPAPVPPHNRPPHNRPQPVPPIAQQPQWFAGQVRCESSRNRAQTCRARTQNRVELIYVHGGSCQSFRDFSYTANNITVRNNCRATFAYGYGNHRPKADGGGGANALPWLLAGAGATAAIVAIANSGNDAPPEPDRPAPPPPPPSQPAPPPPPEPAPPATPQPPFPSLPPAKLEANIQMLTQAQQPSMQTCLFEGSRQVGLSGGSHVRLDAVDQIEQGNGGWRFRFRGTGTWPNGQRQFSVFCRATPTSIIEFTPTPLGTTN